VGEGIMNIKILKEKIELLFITRKKVSHPLQENPKGLGRIHEPILNDYTLYYQDNPKLPAYDWWLCALMHGNDGQNYLMLISFHPKWTNYKFGRESSVTETSFPDNQYDSAWWTEEVGYEKQKESIILWHPKGEDYKNLAGIYTSWIMEPGKHHLIVNTVKTHLDLKFESLGLPFWFNKGYEGILMPRSTPLIGFEDFMAVEGDVVLKNEKGNKKIHLRGYGFNEHMCFKKLNFEWKRADWVGFMFDHLYAGFLQLDFDYMDGGIYLRKEKKYIIPTNFTIEYTKCVPGGKELNKKSKLPIEMHILAETVEGTLDVTGKSVGRLAIAKDHDHQIGLILEGKFTFNDGRVIKLKKGFGWDAVTLRH
jgi:hypothetical protein